MWKTSSSQANPVVFCLEVGQWLKFRIAVSDEIKFAQHVTIWREQHEAT